MNREIVDFFTLHRRIFGLCGHCQALFRLSDCQVYLRRRPQSDWMTDHERDDARLEALEQKIDAQEAAVREQAVDKGHYDWATLRVSDDGTVKAE